MKGSKEPGEEEDAWGSTKTTVSTVTGEEA